MGQLSVKDPTNAEWQHELAVLHSRIGLLQKQDDKRGALVEYRSYQEIMAQLPPNIRENHGWQSEEAYIHHVVGSLLEDQQGKPSDAVEEFEAELAIRRRLHASGSSADTKAALVKALGASSFCLLFNHRAEDAADRAQEALALDPTAVWIETNRAHAYLFLGRFDEAQAIYRENKDKRLSDGRTFGKTVADDFEAFRKNGIDVPAMREIEASLSAKASSQ
jgi:tetratricopeptide (TPR) repeat protein